MYNVKVPALDGCFTQGNSLEEAIENSKEAIACYIEVLQKVNPIKLSANAVAKKVEVVI